MKRATRVTFIKIFACRTSILFLKPTERFRANPSQTWVAEAGLFWISASSLLRRNICSVWAPMCEIQFLSWNGVFNRAALSQRNQLGFALQCSTERPESHWTVPPAPLNPSKSNPTNKSALLQEIVEFRFAKAPVLAEWNVCECISGNSGTARWARTWILFIF